MKLEAATLRSQVEHSITGIICLSMSGQNFLLVDLREFLFRFRVGGRKKIKKAVSAFFLISPETVKLVIGKPTVCIQSLNILSFS